MKYISHLIYNLFCLKYKNGDLYRFNNLVILTVKQHIFPRKYKYNLLSNSPIGSGVEAFWISSLYLRYLVIISPWKRAWLFIWTNWNPLHQGCFVPSLVEIGPVVLDKKIKLWKVYRQTDGQMDGRTDDGRRAIRKTHFSFKLRWVKTLLNFNKGSCSKIFFKVIKEKGKIMYWILWWYIFVQCLVQMTANLLFW